MDLSAWVCLLSLVAMSLIHWLHARWYTKASARWMASNDRLLAVLRERPVTNSQEGDEVR